MIMAARHLLLGLLAAGWASAATVPQPLTRLSCNASALAPGSILKLTAKLDQSGACGSSDCPPANHWPCAIAGPATGLPATIIMPPDDCALHAGGDITFSGRLVFVAGHAKDCCHDGEGHGSIACTDSSGTITIAPGAMITVQPRSPDDPEDSISPGGFYADGGFTIFGMVTATGLAGGRNGLIASGGGASASRRRRMHNGSERVRSGGGDATGVLHVTATGVVIVRGCAKVGLGCALSAGGDGARVDGLVECHDYHGGGAGGCISSGNRFVLGPTGVVRASNATDGDAGGVITSGIITMEGGLITAENIRVGSSGGVLTADQVNMSGNATVISRNVHSDGGGATMSTGNLTLRDSARIMDFGGWGGDMGAIGLARIEMYDDSYVYCEGSHGDSCGGCISGEIVMLDNSTIRTRNASAKSQGGSLCGIYPNKDSPDCQPPSKTDPFGHCPGQSLTVNGAATIDIVNSTAQGDSGGAIWAHNVTLRGGAFRVRLEDSSAPCGGAIAADKNGEGFVFVDGSEGGSLLVVNAKELDTSQGCLSIEANLRGADRELIEQPCSACAAPGFPPSHKTACECASQVANASIRECCTAALMGAGG